MCGGENLGPSPRRLGVEAASGVSTPSGGGRQCGCLAAASAAAAALSPRRHGRRGDTAASDIAGVPCRQQYAADGPHATHVA
jgi:hypothetical protein